MLLRTATSALTAFAAFALVGACKPEASRDDGPVAEQASTTVSRSDDGGTVRASCSWSKETCQAGQLCNDREARGMGVSGTWPYDWPDGCYSACDAGCAPDEICASLHVRGGMEKPWLRWVCGPRDYDLGNRTPRHVNNPTLSTAEVEGRCALLFGTLEPSLRNLVSPSRHPVHGVPLWVVRTFSDGGFESWLPAGSRCSDDEFTVQDEPSPSFTDWVAIGASFADTPGREFIRFHASLMPQRIDGVFGNSMTDAMAFVRRSPDGGWSLEHPDPSTNGLGWRLIGGDASSAELVLPAPEEVHVIGALDVAAVRQVVHRNRQQIRYCQESELLLHHPAAGHLLVDFEIAADGSVGTAQMRASDTKNSDLDRCVLTRFRSWLFLKPKNSQAVKIEFPFDLKVGSAE